MTPQEAQREYLREWRKKNPEKVKQYTQNAKERQTKYLREWRAKNPEKVKEYAKRYWSKKAEQAEQEAAHAEYPLRYKPYKEKDTECDQCKRFLDCRKKGNLLEITVSRDVKRHYMIGLGIPCPKRHGG